MAKVRVELVKYDMDKTTKRKRKNMLVDSKNEKAVIAQLERIHKGEKVVKIHEIIWDDEHNKESARKEEVKLSQLKYGDVKFFDETKGFGFISPDDEELEDLFFHKSAVGDQKLDDYERVSFEVSEGPKGLTAIHVKLIE